MTFTNQALIFLLCYIVILILIIVLFFLPIMRVIPLAERLIALAAYSGAFIVLSIAAVYSVNCMVVGECNVWAWILAILTILATIFTVIMYIYYMVRLSKYISLANDLSSAVGTSVTTTTTTTTTDDTNKVAQQ
jgi:hypothetical protein